MVVVDDLRSQFYQARQRWAAIETDIAQLGLDRDQRVTRWTQEILTLKHATCRGFRSGSRARGRAGSLERNHRADGGGGGYDTCGNRHTSQPWRNSICARHSECRTRGAGVFERARGQAHRAEYDGPPVANNGQTRGVRNHSRPGQIGLALSIVVGGGAGTGYKPDLDRAICFWRCSAACPNCAGKG